MGVNTTQVADNGGYLAVSSENTTLTTALEEMTNELESQGAPQSQTKSLVAYNTVSGKFAVVAVVKRH